MRSQILDIQCFNSKVLNTHFFNMRLRNKLSNSLNSLFNNICAFSLIVMTMVALPLQAQAKAIIESNILVFGDSLSAAYGIAQNQGWVSLLEQRLKQQQYPYKVINASISGETTSGGLSRFKNAIKLHKPSIIILELGANDGLRGLSASDTFNNLDAMLALAKPAKVLLLGMKIPPNYGLKYSAEFSNNYQKLAKKHRANLVPFMLDGIAGKPNLVQEDGLHPTAAAQAILLENSWPQLKSLLKLTKAKNN